MSKRMEDLPAGSPNQAKAKRAALHPARPGEACKAPPGNYVPIVDRRKCEGKGDCVDVCPYDVFEVGQISGEDFSALDLLGKLKSLAHGRKTALTPRLDACRACGLCVVACPESALTLVSPTTR